MIPVRASGHRRRDAKNPSAGILGVMSATDDILERRDVTKKLSYHQSQ
jgi:hypothetical protein